MSGCVEGILVDLNEPVEELIQLDAAGCKVDQLIDLNDSASSGRKPISETDSVELFRSEQKDVQCLIQMDSPLHADEQLISKLVEPVASASCSNNTSFDVTPLYTIETETFDFDLPITPVTVSDRSSSVEELTGSGQDEEEVFFGPVGFHERCVATVVDSATKGNKPLSPLNSRQMAEIFKEANAVADRISAAADPAKKKVVKNNLFCAEKLKLNGKSEIFNSEAVEKLLHSVDKKLSDSSNTENKENSDSCQSDDMLDRRVPEETDVSALVDILALSAKVSKSNSSGSDGENPDTPSRRHNRSGTYTVSKTPHDKLPDNKRKSLPVVKNIAGLPTSETKKVVRKRSLQPPANSKLSKLQEPAVKKPLVKSSPPKKENLSTELITTKESKLKPKFGLVAPNKATGCLKDSALPSKLKLHTAVPTAKITATTASNIPAKSVPQRSGIPGFKGKVIPVSKLQLKKPSGLQRPGTIVQGKVDDIPKKTGPMKAFNAAAVKQEAEKKEAEDMSTPAKEEKKVKPRNLSSSLTTPNRTGSASSMDSPMSSVKKRRSFLPTPNKSRMSSSSSVPSPGLSRAGSTSSQKSVESPLVTLARQRRPSSGSRSTNKNGNLDYDDLSPSGMKPKKELVTNTPNLQKRKVSPWSPVIKQKLSLEDQAIVCTKKVRLN